MGACLRRGPDACSAALTVAGGWRCACRLRGRAENGRGLGAAIDHLFRVGVPAIAALEHSLLEYATQALSIVPGLRPIGTAANKASVLSFTIPGVHHPGSLQ